MKGTNWMIIPLLMRKKEDKKIQEIEDEGKGERVKKKVLIGMREVLIG